MSLHEPTFQQLKDMGIDAPLARAAALRFSTTDAAVNWCFGEGQSWKPEDDKVPPLYNSGRAKSPDVSHSGVDTRSPPPPTPLRPRPQSLVAPPHPLPPRPRASPTKYDAPLYPPPDYPPHTASSPRAPSTSIAPFASNNPFNIASNSQHTTSVGPMAMEDDENEELQRALEMSTGAAQDGRTEDDGQRRNERERSVRASGVPPPSPEMDGAQVMGTLFGPSEKDDKDGSMAMVPATLTSAPQNNEDDDLNRAIADSLMTASFHSASAIKDVNRPVPTQRAEGAPLVLYSQSGNSTYAAVYLQAILAIPQVREAILLSVDSPAPDTSTYMKMSYLQELAERMTREDKSFEEVDQTLKELRDGNEPAQLPPADVTNEFQHRMIGLLDIIISVTKDNPLFDRTKATQDYWSDPSSLFASRIIMDVEQSSTFVHFARGIKSPRDLYTGLADILWSYHSPNSIIDTASDVLTVKLLWDRNADRELWRIDETIYLDRFMRENAATSAQIRAQQAVAQGNVRRLKSKIDSLTMHGGQDILQSLSALVEHYETSPKLSDEFRQPNKSELKQKLVDTLGQIKTLKASLDEELDREAKAAGTAAFDIEDPAFQRYKYTLRSVLCHDGSLVAGHHIYAYIRGDDGSWWRIQEHEATKVEFETIVTDRTGLFMDGGPYYLMYSRDGPRPAFEPRVDPQVPPQDIDTDLLSHTPVDTVQTQDEPMEPELTGTSANKPTFTEPVHDVGTDAEGAVSEPQRDKLDKLDGEQADEVKVKSDTSADMDIRIENSPGPDPEGPLPQ